MLTDSACVVEISGIMGAGFPPDLLSYVATCLRQSFFALESGRPRPLRIRYYVDNTLLRKRAPMRWELANKLINREGTALSNEEVESLAETSRVADELILADIES